MRAHREGDRGDREGEPPGAPGPSSSAGPEGGSAGFSGHDVRDEELRILFEAARCAPSSFNEQPWRFIVARRDDRQAFDAMRSCVTGSPRWVESAPVLVLVAAHTRFGRTGSLNEQARHDAGRAMGRLVARAMMIELYVHRVRAVLRERARRASGIPEDVDVLEAAAIGFVGGDPLPPDELAELAADECARPRKPLEELVYEGGWGIPARFVEASRSRP